MALKTDYPWFFFYRIARLSLLVFLPTLFLLLFIYRSTYKSGLITQMTLEIEESLKTTRFTLEKSRLDAEDWCQGLPETDDVRFSLVNKQGTVLCDTLKSRKGTQIKNMAEIESAFEDEFSWNKRHSDHFKGQSIFATLRLSPTLVLRKVVPITSLRDDFGRFDRVLFFRIVPFALLSYLIFLYLFFRATKPLGSVLAKVQKFKDDLPFDKTLALFYKKDEWAHVEEALNKTEKRLQDQVAQAKTENEKIAAILESIYDDIIAVDPFETLLFHNSNFERNFMQGKSEGELLPKLWRTFSDEKVLRAFRNVLKTGETTSLSGLSLLSSRHPEKFFDLRITPLKSGEGKIIGALGVFYDVTEVRLTEQMRVDFVANVSHEIRTPLTSVKGFTQVLQSQKSKVAPELHEFMDRIVSNTERMINLFNDLLNLSVIESKNLVQFERFPLHDVVEFVSEGIIAGYPGLAITVHHDLKLPLLKADPRLMEQVLANLLDNACKYGVRKDITITIKSREDQGRALITVTDDGPGIPKEHLQRIFERFYRVDSSREASRGTGLGLSIVKHIVAKHGGKIWAESQGTGTSFFIQLPLD